MLTSHSNEPKQLRIERENKTNQSELGAAQSNQVNHPKD